MKKSKEENDNSDEVSKKEEIGLFAIHYNRYLKRNKFKHTDKGLVNFKNIHHLRRIKRKKMMRLRVKNVVNWDTIELHVQVSPNIIKAKTRFSTRRRENLPKVVKPTPCGKKRLIVSSPIHARVQMMSVPTFG